MTVESRESQTTQRFQRPTDRVIVDLAGPLVGAFLFLGSSALLLTGAFAADDPLFRIVGVPVFGGFGLLMAAWVPNGIRRGLNRTVLEVGPDGMWTPEMGRLAWSEIADVRIEAVQGFAGGYHESSGAPVSMGDVTVETDDVRATDIPSATYARLGIVPSDPARTTRERGRLGWRLASWLTSVARSARPAAKVQDLSKLAPFGVYAHEIHGTLGIVVQAVEVYRPVSWG